VLIGFRPAELMLGRFLPLLVGGTAFAALVGVAMTLASSPVSVAALFGSCLLVPPIAVSLGLAVAAVLPHDLEGTLVIIGLVGLQLALSGGAWVNGILPMNGHIQLAYLAGGFPADPVGLMLVHSLVYVVALLAIAAAGWSLRVRVRRGRPAAPAQ
jgi:hypothetical protein